MPAPIAKGIIIAASVLVAAGIAAYNENPQFREWLDRSREKIAVAFSGVSEDRRNSRPRQNDRSMSEDQDEKAEERRRKARQEILDKGRLLQERIKRQKGSGDASEQYSLDEKRSSSFDKLVDEHGNLRVQDDVNKAESSAVEAQDINGTIRSRHADLDHQAAGLHQSVDAPILLRQMNGHQASATEPWESRYEKEMRNTWNISLPDRAVTAASTHASESLLDLTPTTEDFPDPDVSIPSLSEFEHPLSRTEYFSVPPSRRSRTLSSSGSTSDFYHTHPAQPLESLEPRPFEETNVIPDSSAPSMTGSSDRYHAMEPDSEDDFSEIGDGIRTPASAWTEVGSTTSGDA